MKQPHLDKLQLQKRDLFLLVAFSVIWPAKIQKRRKELTIFLSKGPAEVKNYPPSKWTDGLSFAQNWVSTSNKSILMLSWHAGIMKRSIRVKLLPKFLWRTRIPKKLIPKNWKTFSNENSYIYRIWHQPQRVHHIRKKMQLQL